MARSESQEILEELAEEAGWSESSQLLLACNFIEQKGLTEEFRDWLEEQAENEGVLVDDDEDGDEDGDLDDDEE